MVHHGIKLLDKYLKQYGPFLTKEGVDVLIKAVKVLKCIQIAKKSKKLPPKGK